MTELLIASIMTMMTAATPLVFAATGNWWQKDLACLTSASRA